VLNDNSVLFGEYQHSGYKAEDEAGEPRKQMNNPARVHHAEAEW